MAAGLNRQVRKVLCAGIRHRFWYAVVAVLLCHTTLLGQNNHREFSEYEIKAAFLIKFIKFVDWPESTFADAQDPIVIGVVGKDPFGRHLQDLVEGKTIKSRPVRIRHFRDYLSISECQVLFVSRSEKESMNLVLQRIADRHVLTIGDSKNFARKGGIINMYNRNRKVRFQINLSAAEKAGLKISSRLLRLADIIKE